MAAKRSSKKSPKNALTSKTIQGLVVAAAGVIAPYLMAQGVPATPETVTTTIVTVAGLAYAAYGRIKADRPIRFGRK